MESFTLGTGASIWSQQFLPAILSANHEIILVTCFWASSKTLTALCATLEQLANQRQQQQQQQQPSVLRIRIGFSSRSLFQKLLHTSSSDGYLYPPSSWNSILGLPSPEVLAAGNIDLSVKSIFFTPFSVMHPKFLIVDRRRVFLPSCNISWEPWLEGCLEMARTTPHDDPIDGLLDFYRGVWEKDLDLATSFPPPPAESSGQGAGSHHHPVITSPADASVRLTDLDIPTGAIQWLPSWHHRNPAFSLLPWKDPVPPRTPLNDTMLRLFAEATGEVYMQTPNLTAPPVLSAIIDMLARGVHVTIVTGRKMMMMEQILTAGTTGDCCIRILTRRYQRLCQSASGRRRRILQPGGGGGGDGSNNDNDDNLVDIEDQAISPGSLNISFFRPIDGSTLDEEPVHTHLKLTIVDRQHVVLGSGNMDRAGWFTSQELGILIQSSPLAALVRNVVDRTLEGRLDTAFPSE